MGLGDLFMSSLMSVVKVLLITAVGSFLAIDYVDILGLEARNHLNNVVYFVFSPALVGSKLAESITLKSVAMLWFMPLNILITFIIGSILGWILIQATRAPRDLWGLVIGCCSAGNLGNLLLIIIPAVCKEKGSPFGDARACSEHGLAYASLSMAIGAIYLWVYVFNIVRIYSRKDCEETKLDAFIKVATSPGDIPENVLKCSPGPLLPVKDYSPKADHVDHFEPENAQPKEKAKVSFLEKIMQGFHVVTRFKLRRLFAPSTIGAIIGFIVGTTPQFRKVLIGDSAPLHVIQDSVSMIGEAAIPTVTLVVGANLVKGLKGSGVRVVIVIGIMVVRYIALPLCGVGVVKGAVKLGWVKADPLYQFVLMLQYSLPPAINIGTMTQLFGAGESECSVIMLWTYAMASVALTLWSTFFLWLVG